MKKYKNFGTGYVDQQKLNELQDLNPEADFSDVKIVYGPFAEQTAKKLSGIIISKNQKNTNGSVLVPTI